MWNDLDRPPLRLPIGAGAGWDVRVVTATESTNADVAAAAAAGAAPGLVLVAEEQTAGRGRLDRGWVSPPRAGLTFSCLLTSAPSPWVPLLAGVAVVRAVREVTGLAPELKWPNDVLIGGAKVAGLLAEVVQAPSGLMAVLGIGLNVTTSAAELPADRVATSLRLAGAASTDRRTLLQAVLRALARGASPADYLGLCSTIGAAVELALPGGAVVRGTAETVDPEGRLVVGGAAYAAGDVVHLRPGA